MKIICTFLFLIAIQFIGLSAFGQSWLWGDKGSGGLKTDVFASNVATNKTGNVYQTGGFETSITFGGTTLTSLASEDVFLIKYDKNGNVLWARQSVGSSESSATGYSVATDDSDNSYITGWAVNSLSYTLDDTVSFGTNMLYIGDDLFIVKYDPNGNVVWAKHPGNNIAKAIGWAVTADKFGHEYVTGDDAFLIKYDKNGNIIWSIPPSNYGGLTSGYSVADDIYGNIYMSGIFTDSLLLGSNKLYAPFSGEIFIAKFDSNGNELWAHQSNNNSYAPYSYYYGGYSIAVGGSGAAYITSAFYDTIALGSYTFTPATDSTLNFFVLKYNPDGSIAWGKQANPINGSGWGSWSLCSDDSNHIYISGSESETGPVSFIFASDTFSVTNSSNQNIPSFLLKLDSSGNVICGSIIENGGVESNSITADSTGKFVYLGGKFESSFSLGIDSLIDKTGGPDIYIGRWQSCYEATGINQLPISSKANQLFIYPNPTNGNVFITLGSSLTDLDNWNLQVIDVLGRKVYVTPSLNYKNEIDLSTLPAAMYFIRVTNGTNITTVPIVKVN